ncbi:hypothetical protein, partial [Caulobacter sp. CCH9-E1]|uniref:hypothetical protein n=1 Tax=Caulobacter sp. CCH9-E1 TaxID=1768768 RepID=UPI001E578959
LVGVWISVVLMRFPARRAAPLGPIQLEYHRYADSGIMIWRQRRTLVDELDDKCQRQLVDNCHREDAA